MIVWARENKWRLLRRTVQILVILLLLSPVVGLGVFSGTLISGELFGITLTDPLAALDYALAAKTVTVSVFVGAILIIGFYFVVGGRVFCSWVCPIHLVSEQARRFNKKRSALSHERSRHRKYWVLGIVLVLSFVTYRPVFELISPIGAISQNIALGTGYAGVEPQAGGLTDMDGVVAGRGDGTRWILLNSSLLLVLFVMLTDAFVTRGWWCEHTCPVGALYSIVGRWSPTRIRIDQRACTNCGECQEVCPVPDVLDPAVGGDTDRVLSGDCSNCLNCVDVCSEKALALRLSVGGRN